MLILLTIPLSLSAQDLTCERFKEGSFSYPNIPNVLSVRKGNKQKSCANGELQAIWSVKWTGECNYEITCTKVKKGNVPFKVGDHIKAKIASVEGECITIEIVFYRNGVTNGEIKTSEMCKE